MSVVDKLELLVWTTSYIQNRERQLYVICYSLMVAYLRFF